MPIPAGAGTNARRASAQSPQKNKIGTLGDLNVGKDADQGVSSKISAWQKDGGGILSPNDVVVVEHGPVVKKEAKKDSPKAHVVIVEDDSGEDERVRGKTSPIKSRGISPQKPTVRARQATELDAQKQAWVRRKSKTQKEVVEDIKHAGLPKKRVISDGHWRKDKSPIKKEDPVKEEHREVKPHRISVKKSVESFGRQTPERIMTKKSMPNLGRRPSPPRARLGDDGIRVRPIRRLSRSRSRSRERSPPLRLSSAYKVKYTRKSSRSRSRERPTTLPPKNDTLQKKRRARRESDRRSFDSEDTVTPEDKEPHSSGRRRHRRRRSTPPTSDVEIESILSHETTFPDDSISRRNDPIRSKSAAFAQNKTPPPQAPSRRPSAKLHKEPPIPVVEEDQNVTAPPQVHGNRMQAWLAGTPDSFDDAPTTPSKDTPRGASARGYEPYEENLSLRESGKERATRRRIPLAAEENNRQTSRAEPTSKSSPKDKENQHTEAASPTPSLKRSDGRSDLHRTIRDQSSPLDKPVVFPKQDQDASDATSSVAPADDGSPAADKSNNVRFWNFRKDFPSTGKRLSTIASVATFDTRMQNPAEKTIPEEPRAIPQDEISVRKTSQPKGAEPSLCRQKSTGLKRKLTRHDDLMSVLSLPRAESNSIVSARSIRTHRTRLDDATVESILTEIATDEAKYQRELRTLVDGVIPVLLSSVLSKADSAATAGLFGPSAKSNSAVTQPIMDMGIALERLKMNHKRMPQTEPEGLVSWAQGAAKVYADYLKVWRMGFQDVIVNLAPVDPTEQKQDGWDQGLPRNEDGDLLNGDGERVDVAFLLKRPLVRLKYLAKTYRGLNHLRPSAQAQAVSDKYQELVEEARKRSSEERARLEDEAAAGIDPTRARDPKSLVPLAGVSIDPKRCVRARDYFDMNLRHSSGQRLDCKIEILIRDDVAGSSAGGDVLFCEVSDTGRWLLFPPILQQMVSARTSTVSGEIVVMIRGLQSDGSEWSEMLALTSSDAQAGLEWVQMMGVDPIPPTSMQSAPKGLGIATPVLSPGGHLTTGDPQKSPFVPKSRTPSPKEVEIPIGEPARHTSKRWSQNPYKGNVPSAKQSPTVLRKPVPSTLSSRRGAAPYSLPNSPLQQSTRAQDPRGVFSDEERDGHKTRVHRAKAKRYRSSPSSPMSPSHVRSWSPERKDFDRPVSSQYKPYRPSMDRSEASYGSTESTSTAKKDYSVWLPSSRQASDESDPESDERGRQAVSPERPRLHHRTSSVPANDLPNIPKLRRPSPPSTPKRSNRHESEPLPDTRDAPTSAPAKLQKHQTSAGGTYSEVVGEIKTPSKSKTSFLPKFMQRNRRSSSPLKHEYAPSSDESDDTDASEKDDDDASFTSDSSDEEDDHFSSVKSPGLTSIQSWPKAIPPDSEASLPNPTLAPSQSASQGPYRTVPMHVGKTCKTVGTIFSWSDSGSWQSLHQEECTVVITPGLIEAFDVAAAHSVSTNDEASPSALGVAPLVALELTPLVPLRRGTALDISIRSPPTTNSLIRSSNNVMFRSRSPEECEALYAMINYARINNPTYIALQNARGPFGESSWAAAMERRNNLRTSSGSWWNVGSRRGSTYRSNGTRPASIALSESSVGTTNSAFSALRRFSSGSRLFNISKSTITSRVGSGGVIAVGNGSGETSTNSESLSSGTSTPNPNNLDNGSSLPYDPSMGTPLGINNAKIRLYVRETASKWRDMGSARLTITLPPRPGPNTAPASPRTTGLQKRIMVTGTTKGELLLDVTLGESCFERVARTGIAVSVWEDGNVGAVGGVAAGVKRVFMIQLKSERDCAYTFGLVGKLRY